MRTKLRAFQEVAVDDLAKLLDVARYGVKNGKNQAVGLTATTGAGKTIIATALIERVIFGADDGVTAPDPGGTFLWMTDMPKLNTQTYGKMIAASDLLGPGRLVVIDNHFDEPSLAPGKVYFLNTQKLGAKGMLAADPSPKHTHPFWEIVRATVETAGCTLYLIVDEAHRGMIEGKEHEEANSIIQRFIKGVPEVMPPVPIVIGISATPERYINVVENSGRTIALHEVPPVEVRKSGLIKERIAADTAAERQTDALAMLTVAATAWRDSTDEWTAYAKVSPDEPVVVPAFIIQVENEDGASITKTNLASVITTITDTVGPLPEAAFVHAFGEETDVPVGTRKIRYLDPSRIQETTSARVIFFKTSLGTGWDCPRAEVMFSFRRAVDATSIAQTIGRMVRTPLARRIDEDERLNSVDVFLPHYDRKAVDKIVTYLRDSGDSPIADSITDRATLMSLPLRPGTAAAVGAIEAVPSYTVPTVRERQELRRLIDLARRLSIDGVSPDAFDVAKSDIAELLLGRRLALVKDPAFAKAVTDEGEIEIERVEWMVGEATVANAKTLVIPASEDTITSLYKGARRVLGGDCVAAYCQRRFAEDPSSTSTARLEVFALSQRADVIRDLNELSTAHITALFAAHGAAIEALSPGRRSHYERIRGAAPDPTLRPTHLPDVIEFTRGQDIWPKHLYANASGDIPLSLKSSWETEAITEALKDPTVFAWLRNTPNDEWALCVPWVDKTVAHPFYPDFLVVRSQDNHMVVDILDPHDHTRPDGPKKAQGLAAYARDHGLGLGHIDLMAKIGGRMRVLHLEDEKTRKAVAASATNDALLALYSNA